MCKPKENGQKEVRVKVTTTAVNDNDNDNDNNNNNNNNNNNDDDQFPHSSHSFELISILATCMEKNQNVK